MLTYLANAGHLDAGLKVRVATLPDKYFDHADQKSQLRQAGIDAAGLEVKITPMLELISKASGNRA